MSASSTPDPSTPRPARWPAAARIGITVTAAVAVVGSGWAVAEAASPASTGYMSATRAVSSQAVDDGAEPLPTVTPTAVPSEPPAVVFDAVQQVAARARASHQAQAQVKVSSPAKAKAKAKATATVKAKGKAKAKAHAQTMELAIEKAAAKARAKAKKEAKSKARAKAERIAARQARLKAAAKAAQKAADKAAKVGAGQGGSDPTMTALVRSSAAARAKVSLTQWRNSPHAKMIVWRESNGQCSVVSSNGLWRGAWQMTMTLWRGFGGTKFASTPERASCSQQDTVAYRVWQHSWWGPWGG
jgi:Transglycosylase-like domain